VTITKICGAAVDYLVITPGDDTPLIGETLMVDDTYNGIHYFGSGWSSVNSDFSFLRSENPPPINAQALQNRTHQTGNIGDSFIFSYTGRLFVMSSPTSHLYLYRDEHDSLRYSP
jgi:hypothetical protein